LIPLASLLAGALLPLALAPFDLWPLSFLALSLWFYLLLRYRHRALLLGWLFGVGKYALGASWVFVSIHEHGNAPVPLALGLVGLFVAGLALFTMFAGWLFARYRGDSVSVAALWFVFSYCFMEWLLSWLLTGFPWLYSGYALLDTPLIALAPYGGVQLLNLVVAAGAAVIVVLALEWRQPRVRFCAIAALLLPWLLILPAAMPSWTESTGIHQAALVQGNIDQRVKWLPESQAPIVRTYLELSEPHWGVDLLLWPEAAITLFEHEAQDLLEDLDKRGQDTGTGLILGIPAIDVLPDKRVIFRNTAIGVGTANGRYVKRRLVPFGEYVPMEGLLRGLIEFFNLPMSRSEPGPWQQTPLEVAGHPVLMAICYEVAYPLLVSTPTSALLLTISNDTWFGDSLGPQQHLQMARMRAVENGRWLLRATSNGVTAIIDSKGTVQGRLPQFHPGVLTGEYHTMSGQTPFSRFGNWPFLLLLAGLVVAALTLRKRVE
jgi:apolipoprotein N-acyltransferase